MVKFITFKRVLLIFWMDAVVEFFMVVRRNCSRKLWYCGMEQQEKVYDVEDFVFAYRRRKD